MIWTKDPPTVDGFYWMRCRERIRYHLRIAAVEPQVVKISGGYLWIPGYVQEMAPETYSSYGAEWAGPLNPPA